MLKGMRIVSLGKSSVILGLAFVVSVVLVTVLACDDLSSETSTTTAAVAAAATTTAPDTTSVVTAAEESTPTTVSSTSVSSTSNSQTTTTSSPMEFLQPEISMEAVILPTVWTRYEETDSHLSWLGLWQIGTGPALSEGSYRYVNESHAGLLIEFQGTQIRLICAENSGMGKAELTLDNGSSVYVDLYKSQLSCQETVWTSGVLTNGTHTLLIGWTGLKNPASTDTFINIDAVEVKGTLVD